jgi:hypothetical protein
MCNRHKAPTGEIILMLLLKKTWKKRNFPNLDENIQIEIFVAGHPVVLLDLLHILHMWKMHQ